VEARVVGGGQLARNMTAHAFHPIPKILHISSLISPLSLMLCLVSDEARCAEATVRHLKFRTLGGAWRIVFPALKHAFPSSCGSKCLFRTKLKLQAGLDAQTTFRKRQKQRKNI